jgi:hypothetical protein
MKKTYVQPLQELTASLFTGLADNVEAALQLFSSGILKITAGVATGLDATSSSGSVQISSGAVYFTTGKFGELEGTSGIVMSLPASGSRTDLLIANYQEVLDTIQSGYVLLDTTTGAEAIQDLPSRKFGSVNISVLQNTLAANCPTGSVALYEVTVVPSGIVTVSDQRARSTTTLFGFNIFSTIAALKSAQVENKFYAVWGTEEYGLYVGQTTSTDPYDDELIVAPNTGSGRWKKVAATIDDVFAYTEPVISDIQDNLDTVSGSLGTLTKTIQASGTLDFPSVAATGGAQILTITVSGAAVGDMVVGVPPITLNSGLIDRYWVSAANTVTVQLINTTAGAIDPPALTWKIFVYKY